MPSKSPARKTEKRRRSKSPARRRSRSRSRGRSPSRKAKQSPSPSRSQSGDKSSAQKTSNAQKTPSTPVRRSARLEEKVELEEKANQQNAEPKQSSKETKETNKKTVLVYDITKPLVPIFILTIQLGLLFYTLDGFTKKSFNIKKLPQIITDWKKYLSVESVAMYGGFLSLQAFLYFLPVGQTVKGPDKDKRNQLRCNGFLSALLVLTALGVCIHYKLPISMVYKNFRRLAFTGVLYAFIISILLYIKSRNTPDFQRNAKGNTGYLLNDFFFGRERNPHLGRFCVKWYLMSTYGCLCAVLNTSLVTEIFFTSGNLPVAVIFMAAAQFIVIADYLFFEDNMTTTAGANDGVGFMSVVAYLSIIPFTFNLPLRFLLEHPQPTNNYLVAAASIIFFVGYFIMRGSNSQKHQFRIDPHNPALAHLEKIPSPSGRHLLVSGWWGLCRHPNYLGAVLMYLGLALFTGFTSAVPYMYAAFVALRTIMRQREVEKNCHEVHGAAWQRYCQRVKYRIYPYIY